MNRQLCLVLSAITFSLALSQTAMAIEKKSAKLPTKQVVVVSQTETPAATNDMAPMKFSTPQSATIKNENAAGQNEPIKFNLGYDENKLVMEVENATKAKQNRYPLHKASVGPNIYSYSGTYDYTGTVTLSAAQKSQSFSSTIMGFEANYQYSPSADYIFEGFVNYYSANTAAFTSVASAKTIKVLDTISTSVTSTARANYCWLTFNGGSRICPGAELIYDSYPVMNTTNTTTSLVTLEMQKSAEMALGANIYAEMPFYNHFMARFRTGYTMGTGVGRAGNVIGSNNTAGYGNLDFDWSFMKSHAATLGVSYISRKVTTEFANVSMKNVTTSIGYIYEM